jgi:hypothetical protein
MKVGDLVRASESSRGEGKMGVAVRFFEKKIWRTELLGTWVDWDIIDPEPVADVVIAGEVMAIPLADLEIVDESR